MVNLENRKLINKMADMLKDVEFFKDRFLDPARTFDNVSRTMAIVVGNHTHFGSQQMLDFFLQFEATDNNYASLEKLAEFLKHVELSPKFKSTANVPVIAKVAHMAMLNGMSAHDFSIKIHTFFEYKNTILYARYRQHAMAGTMKPVHVEGRVSALKDYVFNL